jgi:hypothetical protein
MMRVSRENDAAMNSRTCMACGSEVSDDADRCTACGAGIEPRLFHERSDVRVEADRLGEELANKDERLSGGGWGRASEHPKAVRSSHRAAGAAATETLDTTAAADGLTHAASPDDPRRNAPPAFGEAAGDEAHVGRTDLAAGAFRAGRPGFATGEVHVARADFEASRSDQVPHNAGHATSAGKAAGADTVNGQVAGTLAAALRDARSGTGAQPSPLPAARTEAAPGAQQAANELRHAAGPVAQAGVLRQPSGPQTVHTGSHAVQRPPVLASEALLRDLAPAEPAPSLLRLWAPLLGLFGAGAAWLLTQGRGLGVPLTGAFAALALLGVPRMPYTARAGAVATVAATGLALVLWADMGSLHGPRTLVLTLTIVLLASGLFFRSWHRASSLARLIVTLGVFLGVGYLWMSEAFSSFTMQDTAWQSWLPRLIMLPFGLLLMVSLLVFMNARTTAGAAAWAGLLLIWYGLHAAIEVLQAAWPKVEAQPDFARLELETMLAWGSAPIFSALLALGLAQLIAAAVARSSSMERNRSAAMAHP